MMVIWSISIMKPVRNYVSYEDILPRYARENWYADMFPTAAMWTIFGNLPQLTISGLETPT